MFAFAQMNQWQQQLFAAALVQRMLPNYLYFAQACEFGEPGILVNQLDLVWQKLARLPVKFNVPLQLDKLENVIPRAEDFDVYAVFPAIDACSGLTTLLQSFVEREVDCAAELSQLSIATVTAYLEMLQLEAVDEITAEVNPQEQSVEEKTQEEKIQEEKIQEVPTTITDEPLYQWEVSMQTDLYELIIQRKENKALIDEVKTLVTEQRLSNLAIEY
ncbi:DUF416 family protein [Aliikangiella maris]|uniref:DUF416 family protein n=2 Tax=Aliikangiella maris TaxID=3162458 RepID=A0ABV3MK72_9GAMM